MMMFCRKCGAENANNAPTCISCGEPLSNPFQPTVAGGGPTAMAGKPPNYLIQSILVTFCCCLPLGIVAIVYAAQVDSKWNAGDHQGSILASKNANKWSWIAFGLGIVVNIAVIALQVVAAGVAATQAQPGAGL
jgi:hypothetical protein